jgi:hypothetical protein
MATPLQPTSAAQETAATATVNSSVHRCNTDIDWDRLARTPRRELHRAYIDEKPIAYAEMAAALLGLLYTAQDHQQPTTITLLTDSAVVYYTLSTGKGTTFRYNVLFQQLYATY